MRKRSLAAAVLAAAALIGSLLVATPAHALNDTGTGGVFVPATGRILDTKTGTGGFSTPMEAGTYRTIQVTGLAGLPTDGSVGAVSLNATVGSSSGAGTLFGRPDSGSGRTTMLIYNGVSGQYTSNTATIAVGADGTIQVMTETSARLILDVQGYYTANTDGTAAGGLVPVAKRIVDTRSGLGATKATIAPGSSVDVQITGSNGIPSGASGVVVNLLAINSTSSEGYLTPYATGGTKPQNALHYAPSVTTSMQAQVPLSSDGKITIANGSSTVNLVIDLQGYFTAAGTTGAVFTPSYGRAYDSRASGNTALAKSETRSIQIAGKGGVPVMGSGVTAVTLTLIVSHAGSAGYAQVYADGTTNPGTTAINFQADDIRTNTITVPLGANGKIALRNVADTTDYIVDVQGWYQSPLAPTLSCASPYAAGSWNSVLPDSVSCTMQAGPAAGASTIAISRGAQDPVVVTPSDTSATVQQFTFTPTPGVNTLTATLYDADGTALASAQYNLGFGDWSAHALVVAPSTGSHVAGPITLVALPAPNTEYSDDVDVRFMVSTNADMSNPLWSATVNSDRETVPDDLLVAGNSYYWTAEASGSTNWSGGQGDVLTPTQTFVFDPTNGASGDTQAGSAQCRSEATDLANDNGATTSSATKFACSPTQVSVTVTNSDGTTSDYNRVNSDSYSDSSAAGSTEATSSSDSTDSASTMSTHSSQINCPEAKVTRRILSEVQDAIDQCIWYGELGDHGWTRSVIVYWDLFTSYPSASSKIQAVWAAGKPKISGTLTSQRQHGILPPVELKSTNFSITGNKTSSGYVVGGLTFDGSGSVKMENIYIKDGYHDFEKYVGVVASQRFHCDTSRKRCWYQNMAEAGL